MVITLLTDFGTNDPFAGVMKGVILSLNPTAKIVDLSHEVSPQNLLEAMFKLKTAYRYFPSGSVHVVVVDLGAGTSRKILCVTTEQFSFLAPDNGILGFLREETRITGIYEVSRSQYFLSNISQTFHDRDIFAPVASYLSLGLGPERLGKKIPKIQEIRIPPPRVKGARIEGEVICVDRFGNLITNIDAACFRQYLGGKKFSLSLGKVKISHLSSSFGEEKKQEYMAILGSSDYLEIARNHGHAAQSLRAGTGKKIVVEISH